MNKVYATLIDNAKAKGYTVKSTFVECPGCKAEIDAYMSAKGLSLCPIFMRATTGVRFIKKGCPDIIACPEGHRCTIKPAALKEAPTCKTEGCNVKIGQKELEENGGFCWKCRPFQTEEAIKPKTTVTKKPRTVATKKPNMGKAPKVVM